MKTATVVTYEDNEDPVEIEYHKGLSEKFCSDNCRILNGKEIIHSKGCAYYDKSLSQKLDKISDTLSKYLEDIMSKLHFCSKKKEEDGMTTICNKQCNQCKIEGSVKKFIIDKIYAEIESFKVVDETTVERDEDGHVYNDNPLIKTEIIFKDRSIIKSCFLLECSYGYDETTDHGEWEYGDYLLIIQTEDLEYRKVGHYEDIVKVINNFTNIKKIK